MFWKPNNCAGITLLLAGFLTIAAIPARAGQSASTDPISTYIFGRADFLVGNQPLAIAAGDFNGDGQPDLAVVNQADNTVSILLGKPDGTFASHVDYPTGSVPSAVVVGDFNGDGNLDLAIVNQNCAVQDVQRQAVLVCGQGSISILQGSGDGTFGPPVEYSVGTQPIAIATGDFNGDGNLDLAVANANYCGTLGATASGCGAGSVSVLLGNGTGGFQPQVSYVVPAGPFSLVVADFNGDHKLDIAVAGGQLSPGTASVLLGNGDGTFQSHIDSALGATSGLAISAADFDGDGKVDLAVAGGGFVDILIGNGDGSFTFKQHYGERQAGNSVLAADFNGDGKMDLAFPFITNNFAKYSAAVMLGNGDGTFQASVQYSTGVNPQALLAADFNGDGKLDLAATCAGNSITGLSGLVSVVLGFGDGTFAGAQTIGTGNAGTAITSADLNGDGKVDIATTKALFLGNGDGTFQTSVNPGNYIPDVSANFVAASDFNGDGKADLSVVNLLCPTGLPCNPGSISVFLGTGDFSNSSPGPYQPRVDDAVGVLPNMTTIGDFNGDGKLDLAVANGMSFNPGSVSILLGKGDGTFRPQIVYSAPGTNWIASGDFNGDGKLDLAIVAGSSVVIALGNGDGTFHQGISYPLSSVSGFGSIAVADFNHDGKLDLAVTRELASTAGVVSIFLGNGDGTFQAPSDYPSGSLATAVVQAVDVDGDGKLDLLVGAYSVPYPFSILIGNGDGTFRLPVTFLVPDGSAMPFTVGDFNQDGLPDVASIDNNGNVAVLLSTAFASVSPRAINFGSQGIGTTSLAQKITISNATNTPFSISGIAASGSFVATSNCGVSLQPGTNCTVTAKFSPTTIGPNAGTLTITNSTRTGPESISLAGMGLNGSVLTAYPARWTFSPQAVRTSSSPQAIQLVNTGNGSLTLNSISIGGANGSDFAQTNNCGSSLAAGAACTVNMVFAPAAGGLRAATLSVSDTAAGSPQSVLVFGSGSDFQLSAAAFSPATLPAGSSAASTVTIASIGGFSGSVSLSCASGQASGLTCSFSPASVTPPSGGSTTSTLTVSTLQSAPPTTYTLTIAGTSGGLSHSASQNLTVQATQPAGFSFAPTSSGTATVTAGQSANFAMSLSSTGGFTGTVNLSCSVAPAPRFAPTCSVPGNVQVSVNTPASFSVSVATTPKTSAQLGIRNGLGNSWGALFSTGLFVLFFALLPTERAASAKPRKYLFVGLVFSVITVFGCGGGSSQGGIGGTSGTPSGTPAGTYTVTVAGVSGGVSQTSTLKLTVQ